MSGFSTGFSDSFSMMYQMGKLKYLDKAEERAAAAETRSAALHPILLDTGEAQLADLEYKNTDEVRKAALNQTKGITKWREADTEFKQLQTGTAKNQHNTYSAKLLLEGMMNIASDPVASEQFTQGPHFATWMGVNLDEIERLEGQGFDLLSMLDHKTFQAFEVLAPIVEGGDFSVFDESHGPHLSQVFKGDLNLFLGKQYSSPTINGEIVDLNFTGNVQAVGTGETALVEAQYTVLDKEGTRHKVTGFLPDLATDVIKHDLDQTDAKAASIADVVDKFGATSQVVMMALKNPGVIKMAQQLNNTKLLSYYPPDSKYDTAVIELVRKITADSTSRVITGMAQLDDMGVGLDSINDKQNPDPVELDTFLRNFEAVFPEASFQKNDQDMYILDPGQQIYDVIGGVQTTVPEAFDLIKTQGTVPQRDTSPAPGRMRDSFDFRGGLSIPKNTSRSVYTQQLNATYGTNVINEQIMKIENVFNKRFGTEIADDQLLDQLYLLFAGR